MQANPPTKPNFALNERSTPRVPGTSLHRQLFLALRDQIVRGVLKPGEALPKEEVLCEQFAVSRITVRRALADLAMQGLVLRRHGLGTFVQPGATLARQEATLGLIDSLRRVADETDVRVLSLENTRPPLDIAMLLQLTTGESAVHALRLRSAGNTPLMLTEAWIPANFGERITKKALEKNAMYELLMRQGVKFGRVVQEISAEAATPRNAELLSTECGAPLLRLVRLLHDALDHPVQYLKVLLTPERSRILMDIQADSINTLTSGQMVHDIT
ncbi:MAG: GntR family transcriptional regulator [Burkholderiaceae bacterium]|nr:GntR family transcriptional regulator [Burkholderiaceae bacterium]